MTRKFRQELALIGSLIVIAAFIGSGHSNSSKALASTMNPLAINAATNATTMSTDASANECITERRFVPTLCSDDEAFLLNLRASIVNEKVLCGNKPFFLTTGEKRSPGGGGIAVSTEADDGGLILELNTSTPQPLGAVLIPGFVQTRFTLPLKDGISRGRLFELVNDANATLGDKFFVIGNRISITRRIYFEDTLAFDELSYHLGQAVLAFAFVFNDGFTNDALEELRRDFLNLK